MKQSAIKFAMPEGSLPENPTECPPNVRISTPRDRNAIYNLLLNLYSENALFELDEATARRTIARLTFDPDPKKTNWGITGVIELPGKGIIASVGMALENWWYTQDKHLMEYWNFVLPEYRASNYANDLIQFGKWAAENLHIPLQMGIISTERTAAKVRLYKRRLQYVGGYFMHNVDPNMKIGIRRISDRKEGTNG